MMVADQIGFERTRSWLSGICGIHYPPQKSDLLRQRLLRVQRRFDCPDLNEMARRLTSAADHDLQLAVMDAASTNHTYFFREPEVLDYFRQHILPRLARRSEMRVWSAASSSGDEAFTLAIIVAEALGPEALARLIILGTDISTSVLERAEAGIYGRNHIASTAVNLQRKYFTNVGIEQLQIQPMLKEVCTFRRMNLKAAPFPFKKPFQAVFCRNVLYYFERHDQIATLEAIYEVTEPGGWLVTSVTENVRELGTRWIPVTSGIYRRKE